MEIEKRSSGWKKNDKNLADDRQDGINITWSGNGWGGVTFYTHEDHIVMDSERMSDKFVKELLVSLVNNSIRSWIYIDNQPTVAFTLETLSRFPYKLHS